MKSFTDNNGAVYLLDDNNNLHCETGPAVNFPNGQKNYYIHGELHNLHGYSINFPDGTGFWHIKGKQYFDEESYKSAVYEYNIKNRKLKLQQIFTN